MSDAPIHMILEYEDGRRLTYALVRPTQSEQSTQQAAQIEPDFPRDPLAKSIATLITPKQIGMIRALAKEAGVDAQEECQSVLRCKIEELSKRAASSFIDYLKTINTEGVPEHVCDCGEPAQRKEGIREKGDKKGQPYVAYCCSRPRATGCRYWKWAD